jgi:DNA-binding NarL/FixJ family response regulator
MLAIDGLDADCAVIDLHLGTGPTGIDVAHGLRQHDASIGIVILTSFSDPRLLAASPRPLPTGAVYAVKDEIRTTAQLRELIDRACGNSTRPVIAVASRVALTDLQVELLRMVADGLTNSEIAKRRVVSERSVETALSRVMKALGIEPKPGENPRVLMAQAYYSLAGGAGGR